MIWSLISYLYRLARILSNTSIVDTLHQVYKQSLHSVTSQDLGIIDHSYAYLLLPKCILMQCRPTSVVHHKLLRGYSKSRREGFNVLWSRYCR